MMQNSSDDHQTAGTCLALETGNKDGATAEQAFSALLRYAPAFLSGHVSPQQFEFKQGTTTLVFRLDHQAVAGPQDIRTDCICIDAAADSAAEIMAIVESLSAMPKVLAGMEQISADLKMVVNRLDRISRTINPFDLYG